MFIHEAKPILTLSKLALVGDPRAGRTVLDVPVLGVTGLANHSNSPRRTFTRTHTHLYIYIYIYMGTRNNIHVFIDT